MQTLFRIGNDMYLKLKNAKRDFFLSAFALALVLCFLGTGYALEQSPCSIWRCATATAQCCSFGSNYRCGNDHTSCRIRTCCSPESQSVAVSDGLRVEKANPIHTHRNTDERDFSLNSPKGFGYAAETPASASSRPVYLHNLALLI